MARLRNMARMSVASAPGTGTITLGSAVTGWLSFANAGIQDGEVVTYFIVDGVNREIGRGTYTSSGTTLARTTILRSTNSNNAISATVAAQVAIGPSAEDFLREVNAQTGTTYTVLGSDLGKRVTFSNSASVAVTLPQSTSAGLFSSGYYFEAVNIGAGVVTITPTTSTVNGASSITLRQYHSAVIVANGTNYSAIIAKADGYSPSGTDVAVADGGTGASTAADARANLGLTRTIASASDLLAGEEGAAFDFMSRTAEINDYADTLNDSGRPDSVLTVTRATTKMVVNRSRVLASVASNTLAYDHDPVTGEPKGVLIEPAATNLLTYSEQLNNAAWTKTNSTITANAVSAPDGNTTADKIVEDVANSAHWIYQSSGGTTAQSYTFSFFAKAAERSRLFVQLSDFSTEARGAYFDLSAGTVIVTEAAGSTWTNVSARITSYANSWYRISLSATKAGSAAAHGVISLVSSGTTGSYTGDGTSGLYIWGAQLEAGAVATSYIPTTTASATRNADAVSIATSAFPLNAAQGTLFAEFSGLTGDYPMAISMTDDVSNIDEQFAMYMLSGTTPTFDIWTGGNPQASLSMSALASGAVGRFGVSYSANNVNGSLNGGSVATDTSATMPAASTNLFIGCRNSVLFANGYIRRAMYLSRQMTGAELQALTV